MGVRAAIDSKGRLLIPSEIRKETGLGDRESVVVQATGPGEFKVTRVRELIAKSKGMYRHLRREDESLADELIRERRLEAKRELDESRDP